jgi:hypothetical protein
VVESRSKEEMLFEGVLVCLMEGAAVAEIEARSRGTYLLLEVMLQVSPQGLEAPILEYSR